MDGWVGVKPGLRNCLAQSKNYLQITIQCTFEFEYQISSVFKYPKIVLIGMVGIQAMARFPYWFSRQPETILSEWSFAVRLLVQKSNGRTIFSRHFVRAALNHLISGCQLF
jgi:hypothetical protein